MTPPPACGRLTLQKTRQSEAPNVRATARCRYHGLKGGPRGDDGERRGDECLRQHNPLEGRI